MNNGRRSNGLVASGGGGWASSVSVPTVTLTCGGPVHEYSAAISVRVDINVIGFDDDLTDTKP